MRVFQTAWYRLALLFFLIYLTVFWFVIGPNNPAYALMVAWGTCSLEPAVPVIPMMRHIPGGWFRVPEGERVLHHLFGIGIFGRLLDVSGWNRLIKPMRGFTGKKAGLQSLEQHARTGAIAHGVCFAIHVLLAILALFTKHPGTAALWMLLPGVVLHLCPVLLQRSMMLRLQPMLTKIAPAVTDS